MPIIKIKKRENPYVILDKTFLNNPHISLKSTRLLGYFLKQPALTSTHNTAAVSFPELRQGNSLIGQQLTNSQHLDVHRIATELVTAVPGKALEQLEEEITHTLLDSKAFTFAGCDFIKKLNTIKKCIRDGKWRRFVALKKGKQDTFDRQLVDLHCQFRELEGERNHLQWMQASMEEKGRLELKDVFIQQIKTCEALIADVVCNIAKRHDGESGLLKKGEKTC